MLYTLVLRMYTYNPTLEHCTDIFHMKLTMAPMSVVMISNASPANPSAPTASPRRPTDSMALARNRACVCVYMYREWYTLER